VCPSLLCRGAHPHDLCLRSFWPLGCLCNDDPLSEALSYTNNDDTDVSS
jgi:hypothetical protein